MKNIFQFSSILLFYRLIIANLTEFFFINAKLIFLKVINVWHYRT